MLKITRAKASDSKLLASLFDAYRIFYGQKSNIEEAHTFLYERLSKKESIILIAFWDSKAVGFTQLYTSYSSVSMRPLYILNDLYVAKELRGNGIGKELLEHAKHVCTKSKFKGLALETAIDNPAQGLYEKLGWKKDAGFFHYFWSNPN